MSIKAIGKENIPSKPMPSPLSPLSPLQDRVVALYTSNSPSNSLKRGIEFARAYPSIASNAAREVARTALFGSAAASVYGGVIVGAVWVGGKILQVNAPVRIAGLVTVAVMGFVAGAVLGTQYEIITIQRSDVYLKWKMKAFEDKVLPAFQEFLKNDSKLADLRCPLSLDIPVVPVRAPDGTVYEKEYIEHWLDVKPFRYQQVQGWFDNSSPIRGKPFTKADLVYDAEFHTGVANRLKELLSQKLDEKIKGGLESLHSNILENKAQIFSAKLAEVSKRFALKQVTEKAFDETVQKLTKEYTAPAFQKKAQ